MSREMRDSGIPWIGEIPKDWTIELIGNQVKEVNNPNTDGLEDNALQFKMGAIISKSRGDSKYNPETLEGYNIVDKGVIMLNGLNLSFDLISQRVGLVRERGVITSTYLAVKPTNNINSEYLTYLFKAYDNCKAFHSMGRGLRQTLSYGELRKSLLLYPSLPEQQKIAEFLDSKCAEVDEMIGLQEQIIEELKAYKQSVITEAVTKGLNPNAPMRDSGIEWIGQIPEHWKFCRLKAIILKIESGVSVNAGGDFSDDANKYVLKTSCVSRNVFIYTECKKVEEYDSHRVSCPVKAGTLIVSRMNTPELVGTCGYCENDIDNIFLPDRLWQVSLIAGMHAKFFWYLLIGNTTRNYLSSLSTGTSSSMQNISQPQFANTPITIPSIQEQQAIADYLDEKCADIDSLIQTKQSKIDSLKEYKKSIIYEYVTGKREVE